MPKRDLLSFEPKWNTYAAAAVHTGLDAHKFVWELNYRSDMNFWRLPDNLQIFSHKRTSAFQAFFAKQSDTGEGCWIISNAGEHGYLLTSAPRPDYLMIADCENGEDLISRLIAYINPLPSINLAYPLDERTIEKLLWIPYLKNEL